jgi:uncharacterized protein (DUF302 family)
MRALAVSLLWLGLPGSLCVAAPAPQPQVGLTIAQNEIRVVHKTVTIDGSYERFTSALETILGRFSQDVEHDMVVRPQVAAQEVKAMEGEQGLMIFLVLDHGAALHMVGQSHKVKQYLIGNPLTADQMTQHDLRSALYAPLRVLVYEHGEGHTVVEYDQPSTLFGQFGNPQVTATGISLDAKLAAVIRHAAELAR